MVVAHRHPHDVGRSQTNEADQSHMGHHHTAAQAAQDQIYQSQPSDPDAQADGDLLAAEKGIVVPAVQIAVSAQSRHRHRHTAQLLPAHCPQITEGPEHQCGKLHFVGKILQEGGGSREHGADGHTRQNDALRRHLPEFRQRQYDQRHGNRAQKRAELDAKAAGAAKAQNHDGKGRAEGRTLGNTQGGCRGQGIAQHRLENAARKPQTGAGQDPGTDPGQPVMLHHDVDLPVSRAPEDAPDQLRKGRFIGARPKTQQDRQHQDAAQHRQKGDAFDLIPPVQPIDAVILQF